MNQSSETILDVTPIKPWPGRKRQTVLLVLFFVVLGGAVHHQWNQRKKQAWCVGNLLQIQGARFAAALEFRYSRGRYVPLERGTHTGSA